MDKLKLNKEEIKQYKNIIKEDYNKIIHKNEIDIKELDYDNSSIDTIIKFININTISFDKLNTDCIVFKIIRNMNIINYAYLYNNNYITLGPNLDSKYGEFRRNMILLDNFKLLTKYENMLSYFEKRINMNYKKGKFELSWETYSNKKIENKITMEIAMNFYIVSWIIELYKIYNNIQELHTNDIYNITMYDNKDINMFNEYINLNKNNLITIKNFIIDFSYNDNKLELTQKIVPFTYKELYSYRNMIYPQWKEFAINHKISHILYNHVSIGFPLFVDWFIISNSNKNLYDNKSINKKLLYNEQIMNMIKILQDKKNKFTNIEKVINQLFDKLKQKRNIIDKNDISNILYSNYSICYIYEYVGDTLYNNIKYNNILEDYEIFNKYMFEIIYNMYCLNLKGIIHGDLHLNNITIHNKYSNIKDSYDLYNLNEKNLEDKRNIYKNINNGKSINIIDYDRSIILFELFDNNKSHHINIEKFKEYEGERILKILNLIFPNNKIVIPLNYKNMFKLLSAYDIYKLTNALKKLFNNNKINNKINLLVNKLNKQSYNYLEQIITNKKCDIYPNYIFLTTCFNDLNLNKNKLKKLDKVTNIFNISNINNNYYNSPRQTMYPFYISISNNHIISSKLLKISSIYYDNVSKNINNIINIFRLGKKEYENILNSIELLDKILNKNKNTIFISSNCDYSLSDF